MKVAQLISAFALSSLFLVSAHALRAAEYGSAAEAAALLDRAVAELKADSGQAIAKFNDPAGAFRDRDLYVFCAGFADGITTAHPALVGDDLRKQKDKTGKAFGAEIFAVAKEGVFSEVGYAWPRPGGTEPVGKISRVTRIGDQICGVGYYTE